MIIGTITPSVGFLRVFLKDTVLGENFTFFVSFGYVVSRLDQVVDEEIRIFIISIFSLVFYGWVAP